MSDVRRVAVTKDDTGDRSLVEALEAAGFVPVPCPVLIEGPAPDAAALSAIARDLEAFDWIVCSSTRAVTALTRARGSRWPSSSRTAAVGAVTAAAMHDAGAQQPIVGDEFTARSLWAKLASIETWPGKRVLVTTVNGGRRDVITGMREAGAEVTELECYTMVPRSADDIRRDWQNAAPGAVLLGSADTARVLIDAIGVDALRHLHAIVPIGPTTAAALARAGLDAVPPARATFADAIEKLKSLLPA